jgi:large subunit ribosomal protein L7/L12
MASNVSQIIDMLKTLTLMESTELVSQIESVFGVDASGPVGTAAPVAVGTSEAEVEEKTTFDVMVEEVAAEKRVAVLKVIRKLTSLGLADAKAFTTNLPKALKEGVDKAEADEAKTALEEAGAKVSIN